MELDNKRNCFIERIKNDNTIKNKLLYTKIKIDDKKFSKEDKLELIKSLSNEERISLEKMYDEQINILNESLNTYKNKLLKYKLA